MKLSELVKKTYKKIQQEKILKEKQRVSKVLNMTKSFFTEKILPPNEKWKLLTKYVDGKNKFRSFIIVEVSDLTLLVDIEAGYKPVETRAYLLCQMLKMRDETFIEFHRKPFNNLAELSELLALYPDRPQGDILEQIQKGDLKAMKVNV